MTAEIAILNRVAVALAADSAVSLTVRGQVKIYNSIDKLFQLSHSAPVGIMIFGAAEYMGIPLETVIKGFRDSKFCKTTDFLHEYADCFFEYLEKEVDAPENLIERNIGGIIWNAFYSIRQTVVDQYVAIADTKEKIDPKQFLTEKSQHVVKDLIQTFQASPDCPGINENSLLKKYPEIAKSIAAEIFPEQSDTDFSDFVELAKLLLIKDYFSQNQTGFVFAGFGEKEIFPNLYAYISDGVVGSVIKKKKDVEVKIDRINKGSHIEPFAQKEMVERFLDGIDPGYDNYIKSSMRQALTEFGMEIVSAHAGITDSNQQEIKSLLSNAIDTHLNTFNNKSEARRHEYFRKQVLDMVHHMPKSDLAAMAESLVNLTSIKRRVSAESETVGGPIDVAIISKNDGFIWIKRKHYFNVEMNPRYFTNQNLKLQARKLSNE